MEVNVELVAKELNDTLIHRACVIRSGEYLANYLFAHNRGIDALELIRRCAVHDISKISNTPEFMSLASIVEDISEMHDVGHELSDVQRDAIKLHWNSNSHHPENYNSPNDMTDNDLQEMACDCHARSKQYHTNLLDYIDQQQQKRFHFDNEHFERLRGYCLILSKLTINDDYSCVINSSIPIKVDLKDSTIETMEHFNESCYPEVIETDRLYLHKESAVGLATIVYRLRTKEDHSTVGEIKLKSNGYFEYKIYDDYLGQFYASEAIKKIVEISKIHVFRMNVNKDDELRAEIASQAGFSKCDITEDTYIYKLKK